MSLGMEIGAGPGHSVLDGDPAPPKRGTAALSPIFGPCLLWPNGWMDRDATWYDGRPQPRQHCVRWGPSCPQKRARQPAHFGLCVLWSNSRPSQQVLSTCSVMFWMYCIIFQCRLFKLGIWRPSAEWALTLLQPSYATVWGSSCTTQKQLWRILTRAQQLPRWATVNGQKSGVGAVVPLSQGELNPI